MTETAEAVQPDLFLFPTVIVEATRERRVRLFRSRTSTDSSGPDLFISLSSSGASSKGVDLNAFECDFARRDFVTDTSVDSSFQ